MITRTLLMLIGAAVIIDAPIGPRTAGDVQDRVPRQFEQPSYPVITCAAAWLWDPESLDLEDWQYMDRPRDLVMGPYGELIAADTGNVRIVRFHPDGTLIEIIGREGAGPGEFRAPRGLAIQRDEPVLWAGDEFHRRISRFRLTEEASEFIDSPIYPLATGVFSPDFAAEDRLAVWGVTVGRDRRITSMTAEGKVYTAFGRPFEPHRELVSERSLNQGYLLLGEHAHHLRPGLPLDQHLHGAVGQRTVDARWAVRERAAALDRVGEAALYGALCCIYRIHVLHSTVWIPRYGTWMTMPIGS